MPKTTAYLDFKTKGKPKEYAQGYRNPNGANPYKAGSALAKLFSDGQEWRQYDDDKERSR